MKIRVIFAISLLMLIAGSSFADGVKPVLPGGTARITHPELSLEKENALRNFMSARESGDRELADTYAKMLEPVHEEEIPMGTPSTSVISISSEERARPMDFATDIYVASGSYIEKSPRIARSLGSGDIFCVYEVENGPDSDNPYIAVKKSTNDGATWTSLITIHNSSRQLSRPRISVMDGLQEWVLLAYESRDLSGNNPKVEFAKFAYDGTGGTTLVVDDGSGEKYSPGICDDGYYIYVSYIRNTIWATDLYVAKSTDFGASWTTQRIDPSGEVETDIAADIYGRVFIVTQTDDESGDIRFARSITYGATWSDPITVSTTHKDYSPQVDVDSTGRVMVVYGYRYSSTDHDIKYSWSADAGSTFTTGLSVALTTQKETLPAVCSDRSAFYCTFYKSGQTWLARWNNSYDWFSMPEQVSDGSTSEELAPDAVALRIPGTANSCPAVVWTNRYSSTDFDVKFDSDCCPPPTSSFSVDVDSGGAPLTVNFTNSSTGATSYEWDFGDGSPIVLTPSPSYTYTTGGNFTVTLTAINDCGTDISTDNIIVTCPEVSAAFTAGPSSTGEAPLTVTFTSSGTGTISEYLWNFGDGSPVGNGFMVVHEFDSVGTFTIEHIVTNDCGNADTATGIVQVLPPSDPEAEISPLSLNFGTVDLGNYSERQLVIENTGVGVLWIYPGDPTDDAFSISEPDSFAIGSSDSAIVNVIFSPTSAGGHSATLDFATNDIDNPILSIALSGTGNDTGGGDSIVVTPSEWDFDSVRVHECATRRVYVTNNTADTVWIDSLRIDGDPSFSFPSFAPEAVPPGASRYHEMSFCPETAGTFYGTMNVYTEISSHAIPIQGRGFSSSACNDYGSWQLCADILTSSRAEGNIAMLDSDGDTVITIEAVAGIAFIDLDSWSGTGLCKFHKDDGTSTVMMAGGFSVSRFSGEITSHPSLADINVLPDSLLKIDYDLDVTVPPITISIPDKWWKIRGVLKLKNGSTTVAEIGVARTVHSDGDVDYELSDFGVSLFSGYFELFFEDVYLSDEYDTIKAGKIKANISRYLVPKVSAWLEKDSVAYDTLSTGRGDWFKLDAKSLAIIDGKLMSLDVKLTIPDMTFASGASPLTIKGVKAELKMSEGRVTKIAGEGKFGYKGLMPDWAGSGAYIRVSLAFNSEGWDRIGLGYHGASPGVPLGTTGFFLTGVDGEVGNMTSGIDSIYVKFGCDLKGGPSLPMVGGILEMTPEVYLDFADDLYRLDGNVKFLKSLFKGYGLLEYRARDIGGGWGIRGEASVTAGISSAVSISGQIDAHVWKTRTEGLHFVGHGGVVASLEHNAIFWLCPSKTISVGAHAYVGEFRLPSDMGGHWGAKGVLEWEPFGIRPQIAYIDGRVHINSNAERYQPRDVRRTARPGMFAEVIEDYDIVESDINVFVARTSMTDAPEFSITLPGGSVITPDSCSTTDSLSGRFYFADESDDGYLYMGYIIRGSSPGSYSANLSSLDPGDDSYAIQANGFYNPKSAILTGGGTHLALANFDAVDSIRISRYIDRVRSGEFQRIGMKIDEVVYSPVVPIYSFSAIDHAALGLSEGDYYVYVTIEDNHGGLTVAADTANLIEAPADITPPSAPIACVATVADSIIKAAWNPNMEPDFLEYKFYKGAFDSTLALIWWDTVHVGDVPRAQIEDWRWNIQDTVGIVFGVSAVDNSGNESIIAQFGLTGGFDADYDLTPPTVAFGTPEPNLPARSIDFEWSSSDADIRFYRLSIGLYEGDEIITADLDPDETEFTATGLDIGQTYYARIVAVDSLLNMSDPDNITVNFYDVADSDLDGLPDWWEIFYFGDITLYNGADDPDGDLLINLLEYMIGTAPNNPDTDDDRISDYHEYADTTLDPLRNVDLDGNRISDDWETFYFGYTLIDPLNTDFDEDGLTDFNEFVYRTNPLITDTDGGGAPDGFEVNNHTDPTNPDDDNVIDWTFELSRGWNMVGLPGLAIENSVGAVFPGMDVYRYYPSSEEYVAADYIFSGEGYFVLSLADTSYTVPMQIHESASVPISRGWNQITPPKGTTSFIDPVDDPDSSVMALAYGYNPEIGEYYTTTSLIEGNAYWVLSMAACQLFLESGAFLRPWPEAKIDGAKTMPPPPPPFTFREEIELPGEIEVYGASPNPFNSAIGIEFALPEDMEVKITISDILGRQIAVLTDTKLEAGYHRTVWNGLSADKREVGSGVYLYSISAGERTFNGKLILVK